MTGMTNEELWKKIIAEAETKVKAEQDRIQKEQTTKIKTDRKSVLANWEAARKKRREEAHQARIKKGREIAEDFIQEIAGPYLRMATDPDNVEALGSIRINLIPGKSDKATNASINIMDGNKLLSTVYKASLRQLHEKELRLLDQLKNKTGFKGSTPIDMMREIARLQKVMAQDSAQVKELSPIATAAQQVLLARAEGNDLEPALANLEQMFIPPHKRKPLPKAEEQTENQVEETEQARLSDDSPLYDSGDELEAYEETTKLPRSVAASPKPSQG